MELYKKLAVYAVMLGALVGCNIKGGYKPGKDKVVGIPLSVRVAGGTHGVKGLSTVVQPKAGSHGKPSPILCSDEKGGNLSRLVEIAALIDSEINDGDEETIELRGSYEGEKFRFHSVSANNITLNVHNQSH